MRSQFDQAEEKALVACFGPTVQREFQFELDATGYAYWWQTTALLRRAEVVMVVRRPDGRLLLHTKSHYPVGTYRLPSGGVRWNESVLEALAREQWEEMGLDLSPMAMPGLVRYSLLHKGRVLGFASYLFFLEATDDAVLTTRDPKEAISDFRWVQPSQVAGIARHLRGVMRAWDGWGPFRAIAHELLAEILSQ
jgi:8-oxo-dGTP pyrophosphatase MutT (NUDIX family)